MTRKLGIKKLETSVYCTVWNVFRYSEPFRRELWVWQTDGETDWTACSSRAL